MKSSLLQLPVDKTPPCGEGGTNKVPFGFYRGFFLIKPKEIECVGQEECWCFAVANWCISVGFGTSGEPEGSIQAAGWAMSGSDSGSAAVLWCLHAPSNTCSFGSLSAGTLTFWRGVSREPPAHIWWVTRGSRGLPPC